MAYWNRDDKIYRLMFDPIKPLVENFTFDSRRTVLAPGCFDLLHYSHIDYLQRAALLGERLIVGLNSDISVRGYKPNRPIIPEVWRARQLAALECVSDVIIFHSATPHELIRYLKPRVVVAGIEWLNQNILQDEVQNVFGQVVYLPPSENHISTTLLIERLNNQTPKE